jgi:branched-chain amino acid transport system substrate-binding protein
MRKFMPWIPPLPLLAVPMANVALARPDTITVDVITDVSGVYADLSGHGSVVTTPITVDRFGPKVTGKPIKVMSGEHPNKSEIGSQFVRRWLDVAHVDMVIDFPNSAVAFRPLAETCPLART